MKWIVFFSLSLAYFCACAQMVSPLGNGKIVELEAVQNPGTGTFIAAVMERRDTAGSATRIFRSIDHTLSWHEVVYLEPDPTMDGLPDPVLAIDVNGTIFMCHMEVHDNGAGNFVVDLALYESIDDGLTWQFVGWPHKDDGIADYPQLLAYGNGELFLVYARLASIFELDYIPTYFRKSTDGGRTWTDPYIFDEPTVSGIGADIAFLGSDTLLMSVGDRNQDNIISYTSYNGGDSWNKNEDLIPAISTKAHVTKPITNINKQFYGIVTNLAHQANSPLIYHYIIGEEEGSVEIGVGGYAEGIISDDGNVHVIYNEQDEDEFKLSYKYSLDSGRTFSSAMTLHRGSFDLGGFGEYQSFLKGLDGRFYVTFCDWTDNSRAKTLVFDPLLTSTNEVISDWDLLLYPNPVSDIIYVQLPESMQNTRLEIMDLNGRIIQAQILNPNTFESSFQVSTLPAGTYIMRCVREYGYFLSLFVKQ